MPVNTRRLIWFGTRNLMVWIKAPKINRPASKASWSTGKRTYLGGGASVRRSTTAHKTYTLSWDLLSTEQQRAITDFADRIFGTGAIYWHDPMFSDKNALPQWWASPSQALDDGIVLSGQERRKLVAVDTPANGMRYPTTSVRMTLSPSVPAETVWIPIPPGHVAWVGAHGQAGTGGKVIVRPTTGPSSYAANVEVPLLAVTDSTRVNTPFAAADGYSGIELTLGGTGTIVLSGLMVQVLPASQAPVPGIFISGQGHSGCEFLDQPDVTDYSAVRDRVGVVARLVETEGWRTI